MEMRTISEPNFEVTPLSRLFGKQYQSNSCECIYYQLCHYASDLLRPSTLSFLPYSQVPQTEPYSNVAIPGLTSDFISFSLQPNLGRGIIKAEIHYL